MASESGRLAVFSGSTLVPIGAFLAVSMVAYQVYDSLRSEIRVGVQSSRDELRNGLQANRDEIRDVRDDVRSLRSEITARTDDRWRRTDMRLWITDFQAKNPSVVVPPLPSGP